MVKKISFKYFSEWISFPLIFITPFLYFLSFNDYDYFRPEAILILISLFTLGLITSFIWLHGNTLIRLLLFTSIIPIALSFLPGFQSGEILLLVFFLVLILQMVIKEQFSQVLMIMLLSFCCGIIFLPLTKHLSNITYHEQKNAATNNQLPAIIHLILDKHISLEGIPTEVPGGKQLKQELKEFYLNNGFQIYGNAYSHYVHTYNAVPNLLNFTNHAQDNFYFQKKSSERDLKRNKYFEILSEKGYQIRIYQSDYINYCHANKANIIACYTYPAASAKSIAATSLSIYEKMRFLIKSFLINSSLYTIVLENYQYFLKPLTNYRLWQLPDWPWYQARTCNIPILETIAQLKKDIEQHPNGTVFFAHLLIPHNPYIYNSNCEITPQATQWKIDVGPLPFINTPKTRYERYLLYNNQIRCTQKQLAILLQALRDKGIYDKATIIIHGDHSSRIISQAPSEANKAHLTQQNFNDSYTTLFAIKNPGLKPAYHREIQSIDSLLATTLQKITGTAVVNKQQTTTPYIFLSPSENKAEMKKMQVSEFR